LGGAFALRHVDRDTRDLSAYVLAAVVVHAALFPIGSFKFRPDELHAGILSTNSLVSIDIEHIEPPVPERLGIVPGGGSPIVRGSKEVPSRRPAQLDPPKTKPAALDPVHSVEEPPEDGASPVPSPDAVAFQAATERRRRGVEMAEAAAAGAGRGENGGPGGSGAGSGARRGAPPAIHGHIAFGNGSHGDLTGRVCFLPVGTLRIADVRDCEYVATVYTDTLNIPERQFSDGFPGVTNRSEWFLIDYTGTFTVSEYGSYSFRLHSDDGSYLYIDDKLVIENDGKHAPSSRSGSIPLFVGQHRIKVRYAQTNDRMALQLFVRVPAARAERIFTSQL
jgi:hypothetical protein